jgi:antitoxin PrlF
VLGQFLNFLMDDLSRHPEHLKSMDAGMVARIQSLVGHVELDLDAPLSAEDE